MLLTSILVTIAVGFVWFLIAPSRIETRGNPPMPEHSPEPFGEERQEAENGRIMEAQTPDGISPASQESVAVEFESTTSATAFMRNPDALLLDFYEHPNTEPNITTRIYLIETPEFDFPIRIEETIYHDSGSDETRILRSVAMAANQIIVGFEGSQDETSIEDLITLTGSALVEFDDVRNLIVIELSDVGINSIYEAISQLETSQISGRIRYAQPNYLYGITDTPNDPKYLDGSLWGLHNTGQYGGVEDVDIDAPEAWDMITGAPSVVVAVIDSGINYTHEDLVQSIWTNSGEIPNNQIDDDGNGYVDDIYGANVITGTGDPRDDNSHGTHCAGTIAASGNNQIGVVGVAWNAQIMSVKFLDSRGRGLDANAAKAIDYAVNEGARVISASWGGEGRSPLLQESIARAEAKGVLFVAAAGNSGLNIDIYPSYPAAYDNSNIVTVASIQRDGRLSGFSNFGVKGVDIAAPGSYILSTVSNSNSAYASKSGTSMATPHVSGALALVLQKFPNIGYKDAINRIIWSGEQAHTYSGKTKTDRLLNVANAVTVDDIRNPPTLIPLSRISTEAALGATVTLSTQISSDSPVQISWFKDDAQIAGQSSANLTIHSGTLEDSGLYRIDASNQDGTASLEFLVQFREPQTDLAIAFDSPDLVLLKSDDGNWSVEKTDSVVGNTSIRAYSTTFGKATKLSTTIHGPGTVRFHAKTHFPRFSARARVLVDGSVKWERYTSNDWSQVEFTLDEDKDYLIEWEVFSRIAGNMGFTSLLIDGFQFLEIGSEPPLIVTQPSDTNAIFGEEASFTVDAIGEGLFYQWYFNDSPIQDANYARYIIAETNESHSGRYSVEVSNEHGSVRSRDAILSIETLPPTITSHPAGSTQSPGSSYRMRVAVSGTPPFSYQWFKNGVALPGETKSYLNFDPLRIIHEGTYHVEVSSPHFDEIAVSNSAIITVTGIRISPRILEQPSSQVAEIDKQASFSVVVEGTPPFWYQWSKDGVNIPNAIDQELTIDPVSEDDAGEYQVTIFNDVGETQSELATLMAIGSLGEAVEQPNWEFTQTGRAMAIPQSGMTYDNEDAIEFAPIVAGESIDRCFLSTVVQGPGALEFYWKQSEQDIEGHRLFRNFRVGDYTKQLETSDEWTRVVAPLQAGPNTLNWSIDATDESKAWIDLARVSQAPLIAQPLNPAIGIAGEDVSFSIEAYGTGVLAYQWFKDGAAIPGETASTLSILSISNDDTGKYSVEVSNGFGEVESNQATLSIISNISKALEIPDIPITTGSYKGLTELKAMGVADAVGGDAASIKYDGTRIGDAFVEFEIEGPQNVVFSWKPEKFPLAGLTIRIDGTHYFSESYSGNDWLDSWAWIPEGIHTIKLVFYDRNHSHPPEYRRILLDNIRFTQKPLLFKSLYDKTVIERERFSFYTWANGRADGITYDWYKDGKLIRSSNTPSYYASQGASPDLAGEYYVVATNSHGSTQSNTVTVDVVTGFYDAIDYEHGEYNMINSQNWHPQTETTFDGKDALRTTVDPNDNYSILIQRLQGPRTISFRWMVKDMQIGDLAYFHLNNEPFSSLEQNSVWERVEVHIPEHKTYTLSWRLFRPSENANRELSLYLDTMEERGGPASSAQPMSLGVLLSDESNFDVGKTYNITNKSSFKWTQNGHAISGNWKENLLIQNSQFHSQGDYKLEIRDDAGIFESNKASLALIEDFGKLADLPGARFQTFGTKLWHADLESGYRGNSSLKFDNGASTDVSTLRLLIQGEGTLEFYWKGPIKMPWSNAEIFLEVDGKQVQRRKTSMKWSWEKVTIPLVGDSLHTIDWRVDSFSLVSGSGDGFWVDAIKLIRPDDETYQDWASGRFTSIMADNSPFGDSDADGILNYAEYALDLDANSPDEFPEVTIQSSEGTLRFTSEFGVRKNASEARVLFQISQDLESWYTVLADNAFTVLEESETALKLKLDYAVGTSSGEKFYARLNVVYFGDESPEDSN